MADFNWFRLGQRPRTPSRPMSPRPSDRGLPRQPSHLNINTRASPSSEPTTSSTDASMLVRDHDRIWYNPSLDQMVEALQVELMTHRVLQPLPVQYNSYILHLIEGFAHSQGRIQAAHAARADAEQSLEKHLEHFKSVADEWLEREGQYKAEIKRLEVLLSKASSEGLEAVTLARTNSIIDRSGPRAKHLVSELKRISTGTSTQGKSLDDFRHDIRDEPGEALSATLDNNSDFLVSERIRRQDATSDLCKAGPGPKGIQPRHTKTMMSRRDGDRWATKNKAELSPVSAQDVEMQPLFSDDISGTENAGRRTKSQPGEYMAEEMPPDRQILENLLDCGSPHEDDSNNAHTLYQGETGRSTKDMSGQATKRTATLDPEARRLRSLSMSGFSFIPGDDALTKRSSETMRDAVIQEYHGSDSMNTGQEDFTTSWDARSSTSSVETVIRTGRGTP
ncbi:hypothetical protein GGR52DRAFT_573509 [Hypoxylon sp. FL1284]|nr:hypothetical protein GGR52DRAFT_573509 [Hypoxylon sp. FL1284]